MCLLICIPRYYEPWIESCHSSSLPTRTLNSRQDGHKPRPSPDTALVAFTQLGALKLNANRSVVTLIGNEYQYILAEASRSSNLLDGTSHVQGEELWWGTAKIPLGQGISEDALHPSEYVAHGPGQKEYRAPAVVVSDLSQTESCRARGCSGPGVRFYAGVPIVTKRGYAIGVYMVADGKPRNGLNAQELKTLVELSSIVLQHLDTIRSDRARARGELLIHGIGSFIKGHATTRATPSLPPHSSTNKDPMEGGDTHGPPDSTPDADSSPPARGLHSSTDGPPVANASYAARTESAVPDGEDVSQVRPSISNAATPRSEDKLQYDHKPAAEDQPKPATTTSRHDSSSSQKSGPSRDAVFQRASRILLECMDADGVAFIDASTANMNRGSSKAKSHRAMFGSRRSQNSQNGQQESQTLSRQLSQTSSDGEAAADGSKSAVAAEHNFDDMAKSSSAPHRLCDVLAMTTETPHSLAEIELSEPSLRELIASYPQPHCFVFDEKGHSASYRVTGDSDSTAKVRSADGNGPDPRATFDGSPRKSHHALLDILPGARTIVSCPA